MAFCVFIRSYVSFSLNNLKAEKQSFMKWQMEIQLINRHCFYSPLNVYLWILLCTLSNSHHKINQIICFLLHAFVVVFFCCVLHRATYPLCKRELNWRVLCNMLFQSTSISNFNPLQNILHIQQLDCIEMFLVISRYNLMMMICFNGKFTKLEYK